MTKKILILRPLSMALDHILQNLLISNTVHYYAINEIHSREGFFSVFIDNVTRLFGVRNSIEMTQVKKKYNNRWNNIMAFINPIGQKTIQYNIIIHYRHAESFEMAHSGGFGVLFGENMWNVFSIFNIKMPKRKGWWWWWWTTERPKPPATDWQSMGLLATPSRTFLIFITSFTLLYMYSIYINIFVRRIFRDRKWKWQHI